MRGRETGYEGKVRGEEGEGGNLAYERKDGEKRKRRRERETGKVRGKGKHRRRKMKLTFFLIAFKNKPHFIIQEKKEKKEVVYI